MVNIYKKITDLILSKLAAGVIPWRKSWATLAPQNFLSKNTYQGINFLLLSSLDFTSQFYLTFKQCKDKGGHVLKGSTGEPVIFWKMIENKRSETGEEFPLIRYSTVFNLSQTSLFEEAPAEEAGELVNAADFLNSLQHIPNIKNNVNRAFYSPALDYISLPPLSQFDTEAEYYSTLFHEIIHSTGHSAKLNRFKPLTYKGDDVYSFEELVAEIGSAFLCSMCGIDNTIDNSAAYIASWSKVLKADEKMILKASTQAKNAVNYLINKAEEKAEAA